MSISEACEIFSKQDIQCFIDINGTSYHHKTRSHGMFMLDVELRRLGIDKPISLMLTILQLSNDVSQNGKALDPFPLIPLF